MLGCALWLLAITKTHNDMLNTGTVHPDRKLNDLNNFSSTFTRVKYLIGHVRHTGLSNYPLKKNQLSNSK